MFDEKARLVLPFQSTSTDEGSDMAFSWKVISSDGEAEASSSDSPAVVVQPEIVLRRGTNVWVQIHEIDLAQKRATLNLVALSNPGAPDEEAPVSRAGELPELVERIRAANRKTMRRGERRRRRWNEMASFLNSTRAATEQLLRNGTVVRGVARGLLVDIGADPPALLHTAELEALEERKKLSTPTVEYIDARFEQQSAEYNYDRGELMAALNEERAERAGVPVGSQVTVQVKQANRRRKHMYVALCPSDAPDGADSPSVDGAASATKITAADGGAEDQAGLSTTGDEGAAFTETIDETEDEEYYDDDEEEGFYDEDYDEDEDEDDDDLMSLLKKKKESFADEKDWGEELGLNSW